MPLQRKPAEFHFINLGVALAFSPNRMSNVDAFKSLPPTEQSKWIEWLVAQELFRRQCVAGSEDPEALWFWASDDHVIDFVDGSRNLYEVKVGRTGPLSFSWFPRGFPGRNLLVIGGGAFRAETVKGDHDRAVLACRWNTESLSRPG